MKIKNKIEKSIFKQACSKYTPSKDMTYKESRDWYSLQSETIRLNVMIRCFEICVKKLGERNPVVPIFQNAFKEGFGKGDIEPKWPFKEETLKTDKEIFLDRGIEIGDKVYFTRFSTDEFPTIGWLYEMANFEQTAGELVKATDTSGTIYYKAHNVAYVVPLSRIFKTF